MSATTPGKGQATWARRLRRVRWPGEAAPRKERGPGGAAAQGASRRDLPAHAISTKNKHLLASGLDANPRFHGGCFGVWGTPPKKPLYCKMCNAIKRIKDSGAHPRRRRAHHTGGDLLIPGAISNPALGDITRTSSIVYSRPLQLPLPRFMVDSTKQKTLLARGKQGIKGTFAYGYLLASRGPRPSTGRWALLILDGPGLNMQPGLRRLGLAALATAGADPVGTVMFMQVLIERGTSYITCLHDVQRYFIYFSRNLASLYPDASEAGARAGDGCRLRSAGPQGRRGGRGTSGRRRRLSGRDTRAPAVAPPAGTPMIAE